MGTEATVTVYAPDRDTALRAIEAAHARLEDVNRLMSDYIADSEIGRLNALSAGQSLVVSQETFACLEQAEDVARRSGGAFDPTCRPLVWLWKRAGKENLLPSEAALRETLARVGWQKVQLDPATRTVTVVADGLQVDLGGIAKGYALDLAGGALLAVGATSGLVNVGGDILAVGHPPDADRWHVGVRDPFRSKEDVLRRVALADCAVATSGDSERFSVIEGKRYSHIVDPRTGWPAEQAPSVTVIAPDGATADAWATVFSVLSVAEGEALLAKERLPGVEVLWIWREGDEVRMRQTSGFAQYLLD
jgi:thiamine biosynthesis lipoprotein